MSARISACGLVPQVRSKSHRRSGPVPRHKNVVAALKRRSFDLYGYLPDGEPEPGPPDGYDGLEWRGCPPSVLDLECVLRKRLNRAPRSRPAQAFREIAWFFSRWEPDHTLHDPGSI